MPDDTEALLERLVAFPTVAGRPNLDLIEWVGGWLRRAGVDHAVLPAAREDAASLHAVVGPAAERGVMLAAHTDVVDVAGQDWSGDPFVLRRAGGRLYGRGTADMKGFVAAALAALARAARRRLRRPLHLALSSDEELGCRGAPPLLDALERRLPAAPEWCLVGEPTRLGVAVRHKGKAAVRVRVRGRARHSAVAGGINAVEHAARLITAACDHPTPDGATISVGPTRGGVALNVVPDECVFEIEARSHDDPGALLRAALGGRDALAAAVEIEPLASYPPLAPGADDGPPRLAARLAGGERDLTLDFGTEAGLYQRRLGAPVVVCGPGSMDQGHRPDEYVEADQLARADRFLDRLIDELA